MNIVGNSKSNRLEGTGKADKISGFGGNDKISGRRGDDRIDGGSGDDSIGGGAGHDRLKGGSGEDTFVFRSFKAADSDTITDFKHNVDEIALDHTVFSALDAGNLPKSAFYAGKVAHDANDRLVYDKDSGRLYYDDDGTGPHGQRLIATLANEPTLSAGDFVIL